MEGVLKAMMRYATPLSFILSLRNQRQTTAFAAQFVTGGCVLPFKLALQTRTRPSLAFLISFWSVSGLTQSSFSSA